MENTLLWYYFPMLFYIVLFSLYFTEKKPKFVFHLTFLLGCYEAEGWLLYAKGVCIFFLSALHGDITQGSILSDVECDE